MPVEENERLPVKLSLPLEFQQDIFRELRQEDELVILARGLGLLRIVTNLLHSYDAAGDNLVLLLGADERENGWIGEALAERATISRSPKARGLAVVNTDLTNVPAREAMYRKGGVFSVTSRILIVDLLSGLLAPDTITGVVALHADRINITSLEAFILRIYRQKNKLGFLKAFSDQAESFVIGFNPLASKMRNLFLRKPSLWPRFQETVARSLEGKKKAEVIELEVEMTENMRDIQSAVLECVDVSIKELKKANTGLDLEDWTTDNSLQRNFDQIIRRQLDPVWHRLSFRTRQIARDLGILRTILLSLLTYDAVSFNKYLDTVRAASSSPTANNRTNQSPWLFLDAADTIFSCARRRVYTGTVRESTSTIPGAEFPETLQPVLEEQPKWSILADCLIEIEREMYISPPLRDDSSGAILIMGGEPNACRQIREYLQTMHVQTPDTIEETTENSLHEPSAKFMMRRKLRNYLQWKREFAKVSASLFAENEKVINGSAGDQRGGQSHRGRAPITKRRRVRGTAAAAAIQRNAGSGTHLAGDRDAHIADLMADLQPNEAEALQKDEIALDPLNNMEDFYELYEFKDLVVVHPYDGDMDEQVLEELRPSYVIMYEPDPAFIRRVEVYRSSHADRSVKVYFMYYGGSVEEQRYLSAVRREKDAFTKLIRERGSMTITMTLDAHGIEDPQEQFLRTVNTRIAGGGRLAATGVQPMVVVDVREFRSSLPSLLHGRNLLVVPSMLTVGDYVLTPDICVERKSVRDLISSFNNGRLYNQAETMLQYYKSPFLLIEFEREKSFTLEPFADLSISGGGSSSFASLNPATASDLQSKLVLLTISFPRLKIIWSSEPDQTAKIFEELKNRQDEPNPEIAASIGLEPGEDAENQTFSQVPQDMLRAIPGVTTTNIGPLTLEVESVQALSNMEEDELEVLVGREAARQIFRFFNRSVFDD